jgi:hypothetical protein
MNNLTFSPFRVRTFLIPIALVQAFGALSFGAAIYDTSAIDELTGSRTIPASSGVVGSNFTNFQIGWSITNTLPSVWHYSYTFTGSVASGGQGLSHFILDTSDNCINAAAGTFTDANCMTNAAISSGTLTLSPGDYSSSPGNPDFPAGADIVGVKFNVSGSPGFPVTIGFDSDRAPVYGDFYLKVANASTAYDNGLTNHASTTLLDFIARPDTSSSAAPEPAAGVLFAGGLLLLGISRIRQECWK